MWRITCLTPVHDSINTIIRSISIIQYSFATKQPPLLFPKFTRKMATVGNIREVQGSENDLEHDSLARFAVDHHNTNQNAGLQFHKVVNVKQQTVAGTMYHITLEAADGAQKKVYEAKVWVKPWENFKEVQDFKHIGDAS